jgi:hypothetical protein
MSQTYRVRFSGKVDASAWTRLPAQSIDVESDLDHIPERLPPEASIMSIEDLTTGQLVHWSRWPKTYRPGFGG